MSELNVPGFIAFLRGEVTLDGRWFGDEGPVENGIRRNFWWRKYLQQLLGFIERKDAQIDTLRAQLSEAQARVERLREDVHTAWSSERECRERLASQATAGHHADDVAVDRFAEAMKAKMAASRAKGRGGWERTEVCPQGSLQRMLLEHIAKGDPVDVGNFAMMIFNRGESTAAAHPVADGVVRDYPEGWIFHSADFSMAARCPARSGRVTLVRDLAGRDWWLALSDEDKERVPLYVYGSGNTLSDAIKDAALRAAQQQNNQE